MILIFDFIFIVEDGNVAKSGNVSVQTDLNTSQIGGTSVNILVNVNSIYGRQIMSTIYIETDSELNFFEFDFIPHYIDTVEIDGDEVSETRHREDDISPERVKGTERDIFFFSCGLNEYFDFVLVSIHQQPGSSSTARISVSVTSSTDSDCFVHLRDSGQHSVRCKICHSFPEIVKKYFPNQKLPAITLQSGTKFLARVVSDHLISKYHVQCVEARKLVMMKFPSAQKSTIDSMISRGNKAQADYMGKLMLSIFNDGKRLNLSAWSWPSRYVSFEAGNLFDFNKSAETTVTESLSLQYINPSSYAQILSTIVKSDEKNIIKKIRECTALSLRVDGSIDRTHVDKIYVIAKLTTAEGKLEEIFLGVAEQKEAGATGLFKAVMTAIDDILGENFHKQIFATMSSICTDGRNKRSR